MNIVINKQAVSVPQKLREVALLDFIRDFVGLKGTKFGCGAGLCGSCTVHIDGIETRSCQVLVEDVIGQNIITIEGLADTLPEGSLHPVQQAWVDNSVPQCGYCQPGQIMTASAFLKRNPSPSDDEIRDAMSGNLCRCGTYPRIHKAIVHAAKEIRNAE